MNLQKKVYTITLKPMLEKARPILWGSGVTLALFMGVVTALLFAIGGILSAKKLSPHASVATWTSKASKTPTCPSYVQLSTPEGWETSSRLFVILYDPRSTGNQYLELKDGEKIQDIPSFVKEIIPNIMGPSDQVAVFQLGYQSYEAARVSRITSYITIPQLYSTPSPGETLMPLPTAIETAQPGYEAVRATNIAYAQSTARASTAIANEFAYNCEVNLWNESMAATQVAWEELQVAEKDKITLSIKRDFEEFDKTSIESPFSTDELYHGGVYNGLSFASTILQAQCSKYSECIVIIIDDLSVWGKNNPDRLPIDLGGASIYSIMPNCTDINEPSCASLREYWDNEFIQYGANGDIIYWNGTRAELNLLNAIER